MNLWDKGNNTHESILSFTCDRDRYYDERLAPYDIVGCMAHVVMLEKCGLLSSDEKVPANHRPFGSLFRERKREAANRQGV